ncbi:MAG: pyrrolysine--tRNA(Pyl) ligase small subunit [Desulfobacterium sp.]|nr:pyrrolysine--tRNA(Pyl) ligase small subunit [Desulfobacterium sp.]
MSEENKTKPVKKRYYRKRVRLFNLIDKIKLWPSHTGQLHGIRTIEITGQKAILTTHCNEKFFINNSLNSRAARWLRNKWFIQVCPKCGVPEWKLKKYSSTLFKRHQGSMLTVKNEH